MFGSAVLEVAIGLALVYLVLALICTTVTESVAGLFGLRSKMLKQSLVNLLEGTGPGGGKVMDKFLSHPLIRAMGKGGKLPSYIPPGVFASALLDILSSGQGRATTTDALLNSIQALPLSPLRDSLKVLVSGQASLVRAENEVATWFDASMQRLSGWYKRRAQAIAFVAAVVITLCANADTIQVVNTLWSEPQLRAQVVQQAEQASQAASPQQANLLVEYKDSDNPAPSAPLSIKKLPVAVQGPVAELLGWRSAEDTNLRNSGQYGALISTHVIGWLLTAFAVSLGAPFWFDTLNRFINIRNAGAKPKIGEPAAEAGATATGAAGGQP